MFGHSKSVFSAPRRPLNFTAIAVIAVIATGLLGPMFVGRRESASTNEASPATDASRILSGLPADAIQANSAFRARVRALFPPFTPEGTLKETLADQGFVSDGWFGAKRMTFRRGSGRRGCSLAANVTWETDDHGLVSAIDGRLLGSPECY